MEVESGPWQSFMKKKYLSDTTVFSASQKRKDSAFWTDMLAVKDIYLCGREMIVGNGQDTDFWGDAWCGHSPLKDTFQELYAICNEQQLSVSEAAGRRWHFTFRRWIPDYLQG